MENYKSKLDDAQLNLINKIIQQNNILELNYEYQQQLPDYIINKKTELIFYKEKNIYKFSNNFVNIDFRNWINLPSINITNTEDRLNEQEKSINVFVTRVNVKAVNENPFEK